MKHKQRDDAGWFSTHWQLTWHLGLALVQAATGPIEVKGVTNILLPRCSLWWNSFSPASFYGLLPPSGEASGTLPCILSGQWHCMNCSHWPLLTMQGRHCGNVVVPQVCIMNWPLSITLCCCFHAIKQAPPPCNHPPPIFGAWSASAHGRLPRTIRYVWQDSNLK